MFASNRVEDVVHPSTFGFLLDDGCKIFLVAVDGAGSVGGEHVMLSFRRGGPNLGDASPFAQLERRRTNTSSPSVYENRMLGFQMTQMMEHVVGREVRNGRCCGHIKRNIVRQGDDASLGHVDETRLPAVAHGRNHALTDRKSGHAFTNGIDGPAHFVARCERVIGSRLIEAHSHQQVGEVDASIDHSDSYLAFSGIHCVHGCNADAVDAARFAQHHFHAHVLASL